jgi:hypothetical protein
MGDIPSATAILDYILHRTEFFKEVAIAVV